MQTSSSFLRFATRVLALALSLCLAAALAACGEKPAGSGPVETVLSGRGANTFLSCTVYGGGGDFVVESQNGTLTCQGLAGAALNEDALAALAAGCTTLQVEEEAGAIFTDAAYGLTTPATRVQVAYTDGGTLHFFLGNPLPEGGGYYLGVEGHNNVYRCTASVLPLLTGGPGSFAGLSLTNFTGTLPLQKIVCETGGETFVLEKTETEMADGYGNLFNYKLTSHGGAFVDPVAFDTFFGTSPTILAAGTAAPGAEIDPATATKLTLTGQGGQSVTLLLGGQNAEGLTLAKVQGSETVYLLASRFTAFTGVNEYALISRFLVAPAMTEVANITVITPGSGDFFIIDIYEGTGIVDGATLSESTFGGLYRLLCSLQAEYQLAAQVENTNVGSVTLAYHFTDGTATTVKLVPYETGRYAIFINEENTGYAVRSAFPEKVLNTLRQITNGQIISPEW